MVATRADRRLRLRRVGRADVPLLVTHRTGMWREIGGASEEARAVEGRQYARWLRRMMTERRLVGWIAEDPEGAVAGSGLVWFAESQPRPREPQLYRPYLLSMYTEPSYRQRGVASAIVLAAVELARRRGFPRITLHASEAGRPIYAKMGFERTWEMKRTFEENRRDLGEGSAPPRRARAPPR